jgi:hypothetical protein
MIGFTRMKQIKYIFPLVFILAVACEKVIDVDLNDAAPAIVIEGNVSNSFNDAVVNISMTSSYFDTLPSDKVSGAIVSITSDQDENFILSETEKGVYKTEKARFKEGVTYNLFVEANGENYSATSRLNSPVYIDSVKFYYENSPFFEEGYYVNVYLTDPLGFNNYYRLKYSKNGKPQNRIEDLILFTDRYVDGNVIEVTLFNQPFEVNDTVTMQLISLDEGAYEYLRTFQELVNNNPGSAAPANPNTNLSNGALGYFSAWSSSIRSAVIKVE